MDCPPMESREMEEPEISSTTEWRTVSDPKKAGWIFSRELLHSNRHSKSLILTVDITRDKTEQDQALVTFYRKDKAQWTSPLKCHLKGDVASGSGVSRHIMSTVIFRLISGFRINLGNLGIIKVFEGEPDHLVPSLSEELLENDMFAVAGRMIGHSFLHGGPSFPGLSPAVIHVLLGGSLEAAPVTLRDCPDLDLRDTMKLLDDDADLTELESIHQLCLSWDLPAPNATNRKWLFEKLLLHAKNPSWINDRCFTLVTAQSSDARVIERTSRQINQFRRGLAETGLWPLLIRRRDVIPILFPRESEAEVTPQMVLDCITWPSSITVILESYKVQKDEDADEDECDATDVFRVSGYLKAFIEEASPAELKSLIKFWTGWEVPASEMKVEIVEATFPTALTCFEKLRLPRHYTAFKSFHQDLCACMSTSYSGFGCA